MAPLSDEKMEERFKADIIRHELTILHDDGLYRTLLCKDPQSGVYHYYITTWPGFLAISGDMGSYVFRRIEDMFQFFRGDGINVSYWAEKVEAEDRRCKVQEFSSEIFYEQLNAFLIDRGDNPDDFTELYGYDSEFEAVSAVQAEDWGMDFLMSYGHFKQYTHHFRWICHAIVWAITQYDLQKGSNDDAPNGSEGAVPAVR